MSSVSPQTVLGRLRAVAWDDLESAFAHGRSRALLMREHMRRAALWARVCGAEERWPFFDVTEYLAPAFEPAPEVAAELEEYVRRIGTPSLRRVCRGAVRWAAARSEGRVEPSELPELPDPYEPILLMFERGGGYSIEEFIDLYGVMIPYGTLDSNARAAPFLSPAHSTLDVLDALDADADGPVTYYAKISDGFPGDSPRGILRRRPVGRDTETLDEAFTRNLRWEPTEYFRRHALGHNEADHVRITEFEAAAFIEATTKGLGAPRRPAHGL